MAQRRQFLFLASLSKFLALFFIANAVSLIFDDLDTMSYSFLTIFEAYTEILLVIYHLLDIVAHEFLGLFHHILRLGDLIPLFGQLTTWTTLITTHDLTQGFFALVQVGQALDV